MKLEDLCVFLTGYTLMVACVATFSWMRGRRAADAILALIALGAVVATTIVGFYFDPGESYLAILRKLIRTRDVSALISLVMGLSAGIAWVARFSDGSASGAPVSFWRRAALPLCLAVSLVGVVAAGQAFIWKEILGVERDPAVRVHAPGFAIQHVAKLDFYPLRMAADETGRVFVNYDYFEVWGTMGGAILELTKDPDGRTYQKRIVADSPLLMRSYGLIARDGELYVSRTGIQGHAIEGKVSYDNAGAITRLRDTDGDGFFEYFHDLVSGFPGTRGPDTMQQNNAICFGPDGSLYITTASAANRTLDPDPRAGCVLRASPDFATTEIFARGFRNPFGLAIGPDGALFGTDNDIDENPGDELNHIVEGAHYGHPFVVPGEPGVKPEGFQEPILVSDLESNYLSLVYVTCPALPAEFRDCFYMTDYMEDAVLKFRVERIGETYKVVDLTRFATITTPVDIAVTPDGEFFVNSRRTQNVYRIYLRTGSQASPVVEHQEPLQPMEP